MERHVAKAFSALSKSHDIKRATIFLTPQSTVKITRQRRDIRANHHTFLLTIGAPNWHERQRIKTFKRAGEPFPVKKVQLTHYPKKKS